jgi:hypothetical protein
MKIIFCWERRLQIMTWHLMFWNDATKNLVAIRFSDIEHVRNVCVMLIIEGVCDYCLTPNDLLLKILLWLWNVEQQWKCCLFTLRCVFVHFL